MKCFPRIAMMLLLTALCPGVASSQTNDWQSKPYSQWTKDDSKRVLTQSPWAQIVERSGTLVNTSAGEMIIPSKAYTLRLRSSLPIRQALLRLRQLDEKYDQMSDKKKAEFDEKNKTLVECPACGDNYVVSLIPPPSGDARNVTLEKMKLFVQLLDDRGRLRQLIHFIPTKVTGQEIVFFFPRLDDKGEPLLTSSSKKLIFTIDTSVIGLDAVPWRFEFDVSKMISNGKVDF